MPVVIPPRPFPGVKRKRAAPVAEEAEDDDFATLPPSGPAATAALAEPPAAPAAAALRRAVAELIEAAGGSGTDGHAELPWLERLEVVSAEANTLTAEDDLQLELALCVTAEAAATAAAHEFSCGRQRCGFTIAVQTAYSIVFAILASSLPPTPFFLAYPFPPRTATGRRWQLLQQRAVSLSGWACPTGGRTTTLQRC